MMADAKHVDLVYGMADEIDFGTSLRRGPYRRSNLATAVARCLAAKDAATTCFEDFAPYVPSDGAPSPSWPRRSSNRRRDRRFDSRNCRSRRSTRS